MPLWNSTDAANGSPISTPAQLNKAPTTTERDALYGNTTANAYVTGATHGTFGVDNAEIGSLRNARLSKPPHAGWNLKTTGSGGRAGRVHYECLVAIGSMSGDGDANNIPNYYINIVTQPASRSINASSASNVATFSVNAASVPSGASLSYLWQKWGGSAFANLSNAGAYSNTTTATLSVLANTASNGEIYRVVVSANGGATSVNSSNAVITITT